MVRRAIHNLTLLQRAISHIYLKVELVTRGGGDVTWQVTYKRFRYKIIYRKKDLQEWFSSPAICRLKEGMSASNNWANELSWTAYRLSVLHCAFEAQILIFPQFPASTVAFSSSGTAQIHTSKHKIRPVISRRYCLPSSSAHFVIFSQGFLYSLPVSGSGNVSEPRLMSQAGNVREVVCA